MKYKVGDKVRIKSLDWYNKNKNKRGNISFPYEAEVVFTSEMSSFCGQIVTISQKGYTQDIGFYRIKEDYGVHMWTDEMIEGLVEDENNHLTETVVDYVKESNDRYRIVIDPRFDIEVDEGEYYAVRRKKEYPKTYEECYQITGLLKTSDIYGYKNGLLFDFQKLLIARDAYWKIAGEEMGLGKPWKPQEGVIYCYMPGAPSYIRNIFPFPTEEMRDAFYENFKELINECKELL